MKKTAIFCFLAALFGFAQFAPAPAVEPVFPQNSLPAAADLSPKETLGKAIFFDSNLSEPAGMSCATCHDPTKAFQNDRLLTLADGRQKQWTGSREIPSISYAHWSHSPPRFVVDDEFFEDEIVFQGGFFADGRAKTLAEQCEGPFFSPLEMGNTGGRAQVVEKLKRAGYRPFFEKIYGKTVFEQADSAFLAMADALSIYQASKEVNPFSSKFDQWQAGQADLTEQELIGLELFTKRGRCRNCHVTRWHDADQPVVLFTKFIYENIGGPKRPDLPFYAEMMNPAGQNWVDEGLFLTTKDSLDRGKLKVPTLRNVAITGPWFHNGALKTLEEVVRFYNKPAEFGLAEVPENVNRIEVGDLNLLPEEEAAIVAFLKTLTDGYQKK